MCGRFTLTADPADLQAAFNLAEAPPALAPRYNIAPTQPVAVVANNSGGKLEFFRWGLIPSWATDPAIGNRLINARAETLAEKPSFRSALKKRRCLILADGFYEWKKAGKSKTPMHIQLKDGAPFAFAGLWEVWRAPDESLIKSCAIITTAPNTFMEKIHDRMPVILPPAAYDTWLSPGDLPAETALPLLKAFAASKMKAAQVSTLVNSPAFDSPECVKPV
ncbi:MAG: SOS response-associated peptidase [Chloroflexi bacterium]|nr:SOS response-associated peptidase [Chloroflexota bacterium]MBI2977024.1 SOS response-associated peptidase [Chloroflexota bacterium]MBI3177729.1 SOS response-associated peptidase [Chloroflexota bacterium]